MSPNKPFPHAHCKYNGNNYYTRFRLSSPRKGDIYNGNNHEYNTIIFILNGEIRISYDSYINRSVKCGEFCFIPQGSRMYGKVIEDAHLLILNFDSHVAYLCDSCEINSYAKQITQFEFDFVPLKMHDSILNFARQVELYIKLNMKCGYLHILQQKEFFVLLQYCYTKLEVYQLFYPIIGNRKFKFWVLENYKTNSTMYDLAQQYHITTKSFSRLFQQEFGCTFRNWALEQKKQQIVLRLSMPGTNFSDIIQEFNFSDLRSFYTFCKRQYGYTATELLKQIQTQNPT